MKFSNKVHLRLSKKSNIFVLFSKTFQHKRVELIVKVVFLIQLSNIIKFILIKLFILLLILTQILANNEYYGKTYQTK